LTAAERLRGWLGPRTLVVLFLLTLPLVTPRIRGADEIEYFSYLHSIVFDRDLEFGNEYEYFYARDPQGLAGFKATFLDGREPKTLRHINFGPLGSALLWSPFYLLTHGGLRLAQALGVRVAADGLSRPYEASACYASALYGLLGLLLIHDALRRWGGFDRATATGTVVALWLGSPVLYYTTIAPAFSHACSLFAVALLLWLWLRTRASADASVWRWCLVGAAGGLAGLVREQDIFFLLLPGLDLLARAWRERRVAPLVTRGVAMTFGAIAAFLPQLLAYRAINGSFGPSTFVRQKMNYGSPHFLEVLFDPGHGLFVWTPLLLVAALGLIVATWRERRLRLALLCLGFLSQAWISGSVESWTQAGAFGSRRFVGTTMIFAWGLAAILAALARRRRFLRAMVVAVAVWWNLSLMVQFGLKLMDRQRLEWPRVLVNQFTEVPARFGRTAILFFSDRERLVKESR
jgi:hypothetical protein